MGLTPQGHPCLCHSPSQDRKCAVGSRSSKSPNDLGALDTDASANIQVIATVSDYDKPVDIQSPVS